LGNRKELQYFVIGIVFAYYISSDVAFAASNLLMKGAAYVLQA
jgi:hypothetical protein